MLECGGWSVCAVLEDLCDRVMVCVAGVVEVHVGLVGQRATVTVGSGGVENTGAEHGECEIQQQSSTPGENTGAYICCYFVVWLELDNEMMLCMRTVLVSQGLRGCVLD